MSLKNTLMTATLLTAISAPAFAESVKIGVPTWTGAQAIAHLLGAVVEMRIGGKVEMVPGNNATIFQAMDQGKGDIDVHPDVWLPNQESFTKKYVDGAGTVTLSSNPYEGNQGFCVSKKFGEANSITDIADLGRPDVAGKMDSDGNGKGEMWIGAPGWASANVVIERYLQDHGNWPKAMVLSAWGTSNMRTGGDDIAQALAFMGVQPVWDSASRRVTGFDVIPLDVLDRPRIDVSLRCSGFFRDAFPAQMSLIDRAVQAIAKLDEPDDMNPLAAAVRRETSAAQAAGLSLDAAARQSTLRVFSAKPGAYGAGLQTLIDEGIWDDRSDFAEAFLVWSSYAYGDGVAGSPARDMLEARLGDADAVLHNQDNREHDILDSDDYYQFAGGLSAAVSHISGSDVPIYHNDHSLAENPITRSLAEEISRVVRGRASNPKWIKGAMRHGYKGAFEMAATVDYLFAFAATTLQVEAHHFAALYEAYIEDDAVRAFLQTANDAAYADMLARFAEAIDRGLWTPRRNSVQAELERLQNNLILDKAPQ